MKYIILNNPIEIMGGFSVENAMVIVSSFKTEHNFAIIRSADNSVNIPSMNPLASKEDTVTNYFTVIYYKSKEDFDTGESAIHPKNNRFQINLITDQIVSESNIHDLAAINLDGVLYS